MLISAAKIFIKRDFWCCSCADTGRKTGRSHKDRPMTGAAELSGRSESRNNKSRRGKALPPDLL
jgi:hypothetical protein